VYDVIGLLQNGETVDTLTTTCFPNLTKAQVYECLAYYEDHRGEIDLLVAAQNGAGVRELRQSVLQEGRAPAYLSAISTTTWLPGLAVFIAATTCASNGLISRHLPLPNTTMAILRPVRFC